MDRYDPLRLDNQLCFPLYAAARQITRRYRPYLDELDLTYTQYIAMMVFWERRELSVKELGRRLYLDSGTLTPVLKSLEAKGFIRRRRCPEDERSVIAALTPEGEALRERALAVPEKIASCVRLDGGEALELYRLLWKLLGCLEEPPSSTAGAE
ncbi:MAG: MarR family transcriptional regulator [Oscillospiraceae bacterium]|nr:MarR family transcriptional regulator [Oscillospiraceae bacterium]